MNQGLPDIVVDTELQTVIQTDRTVHTSFATNNANPRSRPRKVEEVWQRGRMLGKSNATVWLETCTAGRGMVGRCRAVKEIRHDVPNFSSSMVARELEAIGRLSQKSYRHRFVRSFGWYRTDASVYIAMEYLELGDLSFHLGKPIPQDEVLDITCQLLEGLKFMHDLGFVHRDLKPKNILVQVPNPNWYIKIADFGISKRIHESSRQTVGLGTMTYMAPEALFRPPSTQHAFSVDIWALGVIVWQMITAELLFPSLPDLVNYIQSPNSLSLSCQDLQVEPEDFVRRSLTVLPEDRLRLTEALNHPWIMTYDDNASEEVSDSETDAETVSNAKRVDARHLSASGNASTIPINDLDVVPRQEEVYGTWTTAVTDSSEFSPQVSVTTQSRQPSLVDLQETSQLVSTAPNPAPEASTTVVKNGTTTKEDDTSKASSEAITALRRAVYECDLDLFKAHMSGLRFGRKGMLSVRNAVVHGQVDIVQSLLDHLFPLVNIDCFRVLFTDIAESNRDRVEDPLNKTRRPPEIADDSQRTLLHLATHTNALQTMTVLLALGAETDTYDSDWQTPLQYAVETNNFPAVEILLAAGAYTEVADRHLMKPLHIAAKMGDPDVVKYLILAGAKIDSRCRLGETPLCYAVVKGNLGAVKVFIKSKSDVNARVQREETPLHRAAIYDRVDIIHLLVEAGAALNAQNFYGQTPLHQAASWNCINAIPVLLDAGATPDLEDNMKQTPQDLAKEAGYTKAVEMLQRPMHKPTPFYLTNVQNGMSMESHYQPRDIGMADDPRHDASNLLLTTSDYNTPIVLRSISGYNFVVTPTKRVRDYFKRTKK